MSYCGNIFIILNDGLFQDHEAWKYTQFVETINRQWDLRWQKSHVNSTGLFDASLLTICSSTMDSYSRGANSKIYGIKISMEHTVQDAQPSHGGLRMETS